MKIWPHIFTLKIGDDWIFEGLLLIPAQCHMLCVQIKTSPEDESLNERAIECYVHT